MAVLAEAISVIVRKDTIRDRFQGGWNAFISMIPNSSFCSDDHLARVGFLTPHEAKLFVNALEVKGLVHVRNEEAIDIAVVDQLHGFPYSVPWLEYAVMGQKEKMRVAMVWLAGTGLGELACPRGWKYEDSISKNTVFVPNEEIDKRLIFLRMEKDHEVYMDRETKKMILLPRTDLNTETKQSMTSRLHRVYVRAVELVNERDSFVQEDTASREKINQEIVRELLPRTEECITGRGADVWRVNLYHGYILNRLGRNEEAEPFLMKANRLHPNEGYICSEIATCYLDRNMGEEAMRYVKQVLKLQPEFAWAYISYAYCWILLGEKEKAQKALSRGLKLDPDDSRGNLIKDKFDAIWKEFNG
ncbi:MAG: tetratricopeptide repeat protein [Candidatus Hydrogenedens sp.]|jgi:hypothetical protein|nr:tetratricopeptide repeat protein [Candidatus Hydrogenedens sp.]